MELIARIHEVTTSSQKVDFFVNGDHVLETTMSLNLATNLVASSVGQNSVASASDIVSKTFTVSLYSLLTTLPTAIASWDHGTKSLVGGVTTNVTLNVTMPSNTYEVFLNAYDIDGNNQLVTFLPSSRTVTGFQVQTLVNTTLFWRIEL